MPTNTTTYSFQKPVVGADEDSWGGYLNSNWDKVDDLFDGTSAITGIDINSGTIDGTVIGGSSAAAGTFTTLTATTSATLQHSASTKLATTATGVDITGTLTSDGLTVDGNNDIQINRDGVSSAKIFWDRSGTQDAAIELNASEDLIISVDDAGLTGKSLVLKNNSKTGLVLASGGDISFYEDTGTTAKFFWDASAEALGIGHSSPSYKLDVRDSSSFLLFASTDATTGSLARIRANGGTTEVLEIQANGNVGIGTTSPSGIFHVKDASSSFMFKDVSGNAELFIDGSNGDFAGGDYFNIVADSSPNLMFKQANTERMRIDSNGNVGIGIVPNVTGGGYKALQLGLMTNWAFPTAGSAYRSHNLYYDGTNRKYVTTGTAHEYEQSSAGHIFSTAASGTAGTNVTLSEAMRIDSSGRVGIGTSSPSGFNAAADNLVISGTGDVGITIDATSTTESNIFFADGPTGTEAYRGILRYQHSSDSMLFYTAASEAMRIASTGELLVGTTSDTMPAAAAAGQAIMAGTRTFIATETGGDTILGGTTGSNYTAIYQGGTERMRLDASGNLLVGKTSADVTTAGARIFPTGDAAFVTNGSAPIIANRLTSDGDIMSFRKDGTTVGSIGAQGGNLSVKGGGDVFIVNASGEGFRTGGLSASAGAIVPVANNSDSDNTNDIGVASVRWDDVYATNGTIQTSDANEKQDIAELDEAEKRVAVAAKCLIRKYRWKDAVAEKGDDARIHVGIIAQDLQAAFAAEGLDAGDYAMFIHSTWTDEETGEEKSRMGVRYSELLAFIIAAI